MNNIPNDHESEQAILGAIFYNNHHLTVVLSIIKNHQFFYEKPHQYIFMAITELHDQKTAIDELLVLEKLKSLGQVDVVGGMSYLMQLTDCVPSSGNVAHYCKIVAEKHYCRMLLKISNETADDINQMAKSSDAIDQAIEKLIKLRASLSNSAKAISVFDAMPEIISNIELTSEGKIKPGLPTGYGEFDRMLGGGAHKGDLIFIGAEPSTGKTSLGVCLSYALTAGSFKGVIFSIESSKESIIRDRLIPAAININSHKLRNGNLNADKWDELHQLAGQNHLKDLKICDDSSININDIYSIVSMEHRTKGIDYILIDYVQLISPVSNSGNRNNDLGEIARGLKRINKDFDIPIIVLSQLNEKGKLRDSGELNQIADVEIILKKNDDGMENIIDCDFRKNRNGIKGSIFMEFIPEYTKFLPAER